MRHFEDAVRIKPDRTSAQHKLGTALARQGWATRRSAIARSRCGSSRKLEREAPLYRPVAGPVRLVLRVLRSSPGHRGAQKRMGAIEADRPPAEEG